MSISKKTEKQLYEVIENDVDTESGKLLLKAFGAPFEEAGEIIAGYDKIQVTSEDQVDLMKEAREKRLAIKKVRTTVENKRKELKAPALAFGRSIDKVAKVVKDTIEPAEKHLQEQESFAERMEAERRAAKRNEREERLSKYVNPSFYDLDELDDETFEMLLKQVKESYESQQKLAEAERKAEEAERRAAQAERKAEYDERTARSEETINQIQKEVQEEAAAELEARPEDKPTIALLQNILDMIERGDITTLQEVEITLKTTIDKITALREEQ